MTDQPIDPGERAGRGAWTEAGAFEVAPGVHRIPLPLPDDGLHAVNVYAIEEPDGRLALIDAGWGMALSWETLEKGLALIGHEPGDIGTVLVTHIHRDHYTQAVDLRRRVGARVYLGAGERFTLEQMHRFGTNHPLGVIELLTRAGAGDLAARIRKGMGEAEFDLETWAGPDDWLAAGTYELGSRTLRVLPTPGHTRGHVVFLDEQAGLLFAGDHVLPHITPSIGFEAVGPGPDFLPLKHFLDSLHLVATFPDARLLPAHGPVAGSAHARVSQLLAHHEERLAQAVAVLADGSATGFEVARRLTWTRRRTPFGELDGFNRMLAISETVAHLDLLVHRGTASRTADAVVHYALV